MSRLLKQEEIDALLNAQNDEPGQSEEAEGDTSEEQVQVSLAGDEVLAEQAQENIPGDEVLAEQSYDSVAAPVHGQTIASQESLTDEEIDALGEVGNICMGSAATTLSMLLNQKVSITSPRVTISTLEELFDGFQIPHMSIYVRFVEGFQGSTF
jgi:flagellar motor switch protein FliN/FliY